MRKIFKILSYSFLYLIISIASAYGAITISMNNYSNEQNSNNAGGSIAETTIPEELTTMIGKITSSNALGLDLEINVGGNQNATIVVDGILDLSNGFENLAVDADIDISLDANNSFDIGVLYKNGNLFFELLNNKFFISTNNLMSTLNQVLALLNVEMPDLGLDLSSLSIDTILGMLSNFEEVVAEDGSLVLQVALPVVNQINLICSSDYTLTGLSLPETNIEGINLAVNGNISYFDESTIADVDSNQYINLTNVIDLACGIINTASQKQIGLNYKVEYKDLLLSGRIDVDIANMSTKINLNFNNLSANLIFQNNTIYLEIYNIYAKFEIGQIGDAIALVEKYFGIDMPDELIANIVSAVENGDFSNILNSIELPALNVGDIDLSILENITKVENTTTISIANIGNVDITLNENNLSSIGFNGLGVNAQLNFIDYNVPSLNEPAESYIDIAKLLPTLDNIMAILQNNTFSGEINVVYDKYELYINYIVHNGENKFITLSTSILGKDIIINIINSKVYLEISETKIVCDLNNIESVVNKILEAFEINIDSSNLTEGIKDVINSQVNPLLITNFVENENGFSIVILDKITLSLANGLNELQIDAQYQDLSISASVIGSEQELLAPSIDESEYSPIEEIVDNVINVYNYILEKSFYLNFDASYQDINVVGALNYDENGLSFTATLAYQNLTANITLYENNLYITAENIKLRFALNDIDYVKTFLNEYFGVDVDGLVDKIMSKFGETSNTTKSSKNSLNDILSGIDIASIIDSTNFNISANYIKLSALNGLDVNINFSDNMIKDIDIQYLMADENNKQTLITANVSIASVASEFAPVGEYANISTILNYVELLADYISTKQMQFGILASYGDINISGNVQLDITSQLLMNANINSNDIENFDLSLNVENGMLYVDYSGLCLKIDNNNFKELIYIVLEVLGIDANKIPFLNDLDLDLDFSQIETDVGSIEITIDDIVNILKMVKKIDTSGDSLDIVLDSKAIYNNANANDITISLVKENGAIKYLTLSNIYLDESLSKKIDATLTFETLSQFNYVDTSKNYIDISGSNELIKALINMTTDTDFHVQGTFDILGSLAGIDISWNVPFDFKINVVGKGDIELYGVIGEIPVMVGVNNDVPYQFDDTNGGSNRYLYIYYKDGYIYLYRSEKVGQFFGSGRIYEKCTKVSINTFFAEPMYYIQYCFGFTDTIMDAIKESMNNPRTEPMDFGNIIKSFTVQDNKNFTIDLNMHELTNNPDLDSLIISLGIQETADGKNYVGKMQLSLYMPLADIFTLTLSTSDAQIVDYGTEVDMSALYDFINNYNYTPETEWEASNGDWSMASEKLYQINFVTNSDKVVNSLSYHYKDNITLPTINDYYIFDDTANKTRYYYQFVGWYEDESLSTLFTKTSMTRGDLTVYAKWELVKTEKSITIFFVTNSGTTYTDLVVTANSQVDLSSYTPTKDTVYVDKGYNWVGSNAGKWTYEVTRYTFAGWYIDEGLTQAFNGYAGENDFTLYAKYNAVTSTEYYYNWERP